MKKVIAILLMTVFAVSMMSVTASANCGRRFGRGIAQQPLYSVCTVEGCDIAGIHEHNGSWYCSQTALSGIYDVCPVEGCTLTGLHEHDGIYYHCQYAGTGYGCGRGFYR